MEHGFALRAPWYVRVREQIDLNSDGAKRPAIQKYDSHDFVKQLLADPATSVKFDQDDVWSLPVPLGFPGAAKGRERLSSHRLLHTGLRKLYQPNHDRFYAVFVEVFCDEPGLPRADSHREIELGLVMRRHNTSVAGERRPIRRLARDLMVRMAGEQHPGSTVGEPSMDVKNLWWATEFERQHADELAEVTVDTVLEAWTSAGGGRWLPVGDLGKPGAPAEQEFRMWRLPPRAQDCAAARTRSLWFGLVPTYSAGIGVNGLPKLDDQMTYEISCFVRTPPAPGHEHCPPKISWSELPTERFRLASFYDPDGTKNHQVSITMPDLRTLAARAGKPAGPGGVRITTPPDSQLVFDPDNGSPRNGSIGKGGGTCSFAIELFMIVAFFVFSLFLPVVVLLFQLWWLLALRFCFPLPSASFKLLEDYFATPGNTLAKLPQTDAGKADRDKLDLILGSPGSAARLAQVKELQDHPELVGKLVAAANADNAVKPAPPVLETRPDDPLCK